MNYIEILTQEEKAIICSIITGREFKELFKRKEQEFSKIQKGFRAKSLNENLALSIAITNVDKPFITGWVNIRVDSWLKEIHDNIEMLKTEGSTSDIALATTMVDSVFGSNVDLYLKLSGEEMDEENRSKLHKNMELIKFERAINAEVADRTKAMEEENQRLLAQAEASQQRADIMQAEYERRIQEMEQEKESLKISLTAAQEKITELRAAPTTIIIDDADYLAQYDDTDMSVLPSAGSDETVSLCGVISDYNGLKWLIRYADLSHNGHYHLFRKNEEIPPYFANRDKIFYKDGPSDDGFYGVWTWSAIPNEKDPSKDYISSRYNMRPDAIEVVVLTESSNLDDLISMLRTGIEYQPHSRKVMFAIYSSKGQYTGILCNTKALNLINGRIAISETCIEVPVYEFTNDDVLRLDNGLFFYRNAFAGLPIRLCPLKSPIDIVKNIVFSSISWNTYKARAITRAEYRVFRDFLGAIPVDDILCRIEMACHCSNPAAKALLDEFLVMVEKYIDGNSLEDEIILSAINASAELQEKTKTLIRADWEAEHSNLLCEAQRELESVDATLNATTARLTEAKEELDKVKLEEERLTNIIAEKEKLAEDVEKAVTERIQKARENTADFIANMAFWDARPIQLAGVEHPVGGEDIPEFVNTKYRIFSALEGLKDLEAYHTWTDVMDTAALELEEAGVAERYSNGVAAFLCAAYIEKQPILLVGPNAVDIAQAFSATIGCKHGLLCCEGNYDGKVIAGIGSNDEKIVIVNNFISSGWINRLPEILFQRDIFYIFIHPYAEDIQVEPKSLYGFMLPLFTEFFVEKVATGKYFGGYFADDFKSYSAPRGTRIELKIISKLALSALIRNQINSLVTTMHCIYSSVTADEDFLFAVLPIAYASLAINELKEAIDDSQKGINITASLKRDLQYVLGEAI